jgi:hypothetical protein
MDAGLPRWTFWPFFLIVFTACFGGHVTKRINGPETLGLFLLLQLPAVLFQSQPSSSELLARESGRDAPLRGKPARKVTPIGAIEFAIYLLLIVNLWNVLYLLRGDVSGYLQVKTMRMAMDAASTLLGVAWYFALRGRLKALDRVRWTMHFCALTLVPCLLLFYFRELRFLQALILFTALQIPAVFLRCEWIPARWVPEDQDS